MSAIATVFQEIKAATPKSLGFHFPAEFAKQDATWLSWPHKEASWPGKLDSVYPSYIEFIKILMINKAVFCKEN
jgi:agmatine deiminase